MNINDRSPSQKPAAAIALPVALCIAAICCAAETANSNDTDSRLRVPPRLQAWWRGGPSATSIGKNHELVKRAFRTAVQSANEATVRVYCDGKMVALGTVVDNDGYVLTKASEVAGDTTCRVRGGRSYKAKVARVSDQLDLALLKVDVQLESSILSKGPAPAVGSWTATPGGINNDPVAVGVVSVGPRPIEQHAAILGIHIEQTKIGPQVVQVFPGSGADRAQIKDGDIITHVNGNRVLQRPDLIARINQMRPGTKVRVTIRRDDSEKQVTAVLGRLSDVMMGVDGFQEEIAGELSERRSGFPSVIQHDGLLRPNQCGGPLIDVEGNVVGINIARAGRVATYALTSQTVLTWINELKSERLSTKR